MEESRDRVPISGVEGENLDVPGALDSVANSTSSSESNMTATTTNEEVLS